MIESRVMTERAHVSHLHDFEIDRSHDRTLVSRVRGRESLSCTKRKSLVWFTVIFLHDQKKSCQLIRQEQFKVTKCSLLFKFFPKINLFSKVGLFSVKRITSHNQHRKSAGGSLNKFFFFL